MGLPVEIRLESGEHVVDASVSRFDSRSAASEVTLIGAEGAVIRASDASSPMLELHEGAPPISFTGLSLIGGVLVNGSSLRLLNCTSAGAATAGQGHNHRKLQSPSQPTHTHAAIRVHAGLAVLERVSLIDHQVGAIDVAGGELQLSECRLLRNRATKGGAIRVRGGSTSIRDSLFEDNRAGESGGAVHIDAGDVHMSDRTLLRRNDAPRGRSIQLCGDGAPHCPAVLRYTLPAPPGRYAAEAAICPRRPVLTRGYAHFALGRWLIIPGDRTSRLDPGAVDSEFPFACSAGVVGGTSDAEQKGPQCAGACPAGVPCGVPTPNT